MFTGVTILDLEIPHYSISLWKSGIFKAKKFKEQSFLTALSHDDHLPRHTRENAVISLSDQLRLQPIRLGFGGMHEQG